ALAIGLAALVTFAAAIAAVVVAGLALAEHLVPVPAGTAGRMLVSRLVAAIAVIGLPIAQVREGIVVVAGIEAAPFRAPQIVPVTAAAVALGALPVTITPIPVPFIRPLVGHGSRSPLIARSSAGTTRGLRGW